MNICMVVHAYYPHDETRVQREAETLVDKGYPVDVICLREGKEHTKSSHNGVDFYRLCVRRHPGANLFVYLLEYFSFFILSLHKLTVLYFNKKYRIVQFHNPPDFLVFAGLLPKFFGAKVILDIHDLMPELYAAKFGVNMSHSFIRLLLLIEKLSCKFSNYVITVNKLCWKNLILRSAKQEKCGILMNLPDEKIFKPITATPQHRNTFFNLIYHGTLVKRYGVDIAIKSLNIVKNNIPNIKFNIIGEGDQLDELINLVKEMSLEKYIYFSKRFIPGDKLPPMIAKMDIGIVPNRKGLFTNMVLNTKLLEYVKMGIPVVISRTIGIESYFNNSQVMFFEPENEKALADKILYLYNTPKKRKELVKNANKFFDKYNWQTEKQKYYHIIDKLYAF